MMVPDNVQRRVGRGEATPGCAAWLGAQRRMRICLLAVTVFRGALCCSSGRMRKDDTELETVRVTLDKVGHRRAQKASHLVAI